MRGFLVGATKDLDCHERATDEFIDFATKTYTAVVEERERRFQLKKSDLRMFGRLDIGVVQRANGKRDFMVSGIEISHTADLFLRVSSDLAEAFAESFASALRDKALARRNGYLI